VPKGIYHGWKCISEEEARTKFGFLLDALKMMLKIRWKYWNYPGQKVS
jgi:hypothetical protein